MHEIEVAAPSRSDCRQPHRHCFHVGTAPAFASACKHECIGVRVELGEVGQRQHRRVELDRRHAPTAQVAVDFRGDLRFRGVERHELQDESHVVVGIECFGPRVEQHVPALAVCEVEVGEKRERPGSDGLLTRGEEVEVECLRKSMEPFRGDAASRERLEVEGARNPDLVDLGQALEPDGRNPVGLEHRANHRRPRPARLEPGAGHEVVEADELGRDRTGTCAGNRLTLARRELCRDGAPPEIPHGDSDALMLERDQICASLVGVAGMVLDRGAPDEWERARRP